MSELVESHPFKPFLPADAKLLMLGTFPPAEKRWCMRFYYPNYINDMWRIFGICFFGDKNHFVLEQEKRFDLERIIPFLEDKGIALFDKATRIRRTRDNASDRGTDGYRCIVAADTKMQCRCDCRTIGYRCVLQPLWCRRAKSRRICPVLLGWP